MPFGHLLQSWLLSVGRHWRTRAGRLLLSLVSQKYKLHFAFSNNTSHATGSPLRSLDLKIAIM